MTQRDAKPQDFHAMSASFTTASYVDVRTRLLSLINANWTTQAISVATQLCLPELLRDGPQSADALACATHCHRPSLTRFLRALTSIGVLTEAADGLFELTSLGGLLRTDVPGSLAAWAEFCGTRSWATWGRLVESVRTGDSIRKLTSGADGFHHIRDDSQGALLFNRAMVDLTQPVAFAIARTVDFSDTRLVVDVGGGYGELIASILSEYPAMRGILFDLAHATAAAGSRLAAVGVESRCTLVTGSFFDGVPGEADAYLLKSVLHNWDDDRAVEILRNCRRAMSPHARLLVIERIAPDFFCDAPRDQDIARSDLNMLVGMGGRERTEMQYRELLNTAGLRITRVLALGDPYCVIESEPIFSTTR
jgi:orsellinic acid C2-O-methyltransferase